MQGGDDDVLVIHRHGILKLAPCHLIPWLAAEGPLAYSPAEPPVKDHFFQYTWIMPGIFDPQLDLRRHYYFGSHRKDSAAFLFDFWGNARKGNGAGLQRYCEQGLVSDIEVKAPIAAYHHVRCIRVHSGAHEGYAHIRWPGECGPARQILRCVQLRVLRNASRSCGSMAVGVSRRQTSHR